MRFSSSTGKRLSPSQPINRSSLPTARFNLPARPSPEIQAAVRLFNTIPGVRTKFWCQGVSGTVSYANLEILVVTPHERFGYIRFDTEQQLIHYLTVSSGAYYQPSVKLLVSSGDDNHVFRATAYQLAQQ